MLNIRRFAGQSVHVGDNIIIKVRDVDLKTGKVTLGFHAPKQIIINREELVGKTPSDQDT